MTSDPIMDFVISYYKEKICEHGASPRGVDWKSAESQILRFSKLISMWSIESKSRVLDFGCGYGALLKYLQEQDIGCHYIGYDPTEEMITAARIKFGEESLERFSSSVPDTACEYAVASGLFNVKGNIDTKQFQQYILNNLKILNELTTTSFAFNMLTSYSDTHLMRSDLYYADPCFYFDYCKKEFSKSVTLLHDYNLYEFTMVVSKQ